MPLETWCLEIDCGRRGGLEQFSGVLGSFGAPLDLSDGERTTRQHALSIPYICFYSIKSELFRQ